MSFATGALAQQSGASVPNAAAANNTNSKVQDTAVGEVVVTAQKRSEHLQKVPESIKVFTAQSLATDGIVDFDALGRSTPGLQLSARQNNVPDVTIRGIGSYGTVQGVGFYLDDVINFTDPIMRIEDIDQIEILKGPQGTLYGGSSLGGAVRYISKTPSLDAYSGELKVEAGNAGYEDYYGSFNAPIFGDKAAVRLSAYDTHDDGFLHNVGTDSPTAEREEAGFRAQLLVQPTDKFSMLLTVRNKEVWGGYLDYALQQNVKSPVYTTNDNPIPTTHLDTWAGVLNIKYDLGFATLTSLSSATTMGDYSLTNSSYANPAPTVLFALNAKPEDVYTQELRLTSATGGMVDWIAGLYAQKYSNYISPSPTPLYITRPIAQPGVTTLYENWNTGEIDYAAFGTVNVHLDAFTLSGGLRVNHSDYKADVYTLTVPVNMSASNSDTVPLPKFTLSYQAPQDVMLYASVAEGFESGKIDPTTNPLISYKPEIGWTYEVGAKGYAIGRSLYYELTAYYNNERDRQVEASVVNSLDIPTKTITNVGPSTTKGVEGTLSWRPITGLSIDGSAAYMDAKWTGDASYKSIPLAGLAPPNSPDWTAHIGATYSTPINKTLKVSLHSDAAYTGSFSWLLPTTSILANPGANLNPSYWVVFARAAVATIDDRWELALRADNLLNQKYFTEFDTAVYSTGLTPNGSCVVANCSIGALGALRRVTVTLTAKF